MKNLKLLTLCLLFISSAFALNSVTAQSEEDMKAWMELIAPGEMHSNMKKFEGSWTYSGKMWMDPSQPAIESKGEAEMKMILGGRYLQSTNVGNFMGTPFNGIGMTAYDKAAGEFVATWVDDMGTGIMYYKGSIDKKNHALTMVSEAVLNPITKQKEIHKMVTTHIDENSHKMEYFVKPAVKGGKEYKSMELVYTRK